MKGALWGIRDGLRMGVFVSSTHPQRTLVPLQHFTFCLSMSKTIQKLHKVRNVTHAHYLPPPPHPRFYLLAMDFNISTECAAALSDAELKMWRERLAEAEASLALI